jgi:hypothetical protein
LPSLLCDSGGGDKKIIEIKTDFKEKAKPKVGSKDNLGYVPGTCRDFFAYFFYVNSIYFLPSCHCQHTGGGEVKVSRKKSIEIS